MVSKKEERLLKILGRALDRKHREQIIGETEEILENKEKRAEEIEEAKWVLKIDDVDIPELIGYIYGKKLALKRLEKVV